MVRYATNTRADDMSDDDNNDGDDSDMHESDGMKNDESDADDFFEAHASAPDEAHPPGRRRQLNEIAEPAGRY